MRPTTLIGVLALAIIGIIVADVVIHPAGTTAAANGLATVADPTYNALLGNTTAPSGTTVASANPSYPQ